MDNASLNAESNLVGSLGGSTYNASVQHTNVMYENDYGELRNKPTINSVPMDGNKSLADLGIPLKTSELDNDSGFLDSEQVQSIVDNTVQNIDGGLFTDWQS